MGGTKVTGAPSERDIERGALREDESPASSDKDDAIRAILAALRAEYGPELFKLVGRLRGAVADARSHPGDVGKLREAVARAHQLHGTAGSYEFFEISEAAGKIEEALAPHKAYGAAPESVWALVEDALVMAERAS